MQKRQFLTGAAGLLAGVTLGSSINSVSSAQAATRQSAASQTASQTILTITGDIERANRGKLTEVADQLMYNQGVRFDRAYTFSLDDLEKLPAVSIHPTMESDARVHKLTGPRLVDVLTVVGMEKSKATKILWHGIDGYAPEISLANAKKYDFILATKMDDQLLSIGGLGPLFALYDADRIAEFSKKPLKQRFQGCPWGLYCMELV